MPSTAPIAGATDVFVVVLVVRVLAPHVVVVLPINAEVNIDAALSH
jgi:hypothetical protein